MSGFPVISFYLTSRVFSDLISDFLDWFTAPNIAYEYLTLDALRRQSSTVPLWDFDEDRQILQRSLQTYTAVREVASSTDALRLVAGFWSNDKKLQSMAVRSEWRVVIIRALRMMLFSAVWEWFESMGQAALDTLDNANQAVESFWYSVLAKDVFDMAFSDQDCTKTFVITDYISVDTHHPPAELTSPSRGGGIKQHTRLTAIRWAREGVACVLRQWLGSPSSDEVAVKAQFLVALLTFADPSVLYLKATSDSFDHIHTKVIGTRKRSKLNSYSIAPFCASLVRHPISQPSSTEGRLLRKIGEIVANLCLSHLTTVPAKREHVGISLFIKFYRTLIPLLDGSDRLPQSNLAAVVAGDADYYLPFRERAPSRAISLRHPSPFSVDNLRTRSGFFSAALIRAVTFSAPVLVKDGRALFHSWEDWVSLTEEQGANKDEDEFRRYFARVNAMGTPCKSRNPNSARKVWDGTSGWEDIVREKSNIPFTEFRALFRRTAGQSPTRLPVYGLGPLCAYLLTADYAYTDLVQKPTSTDIGRAILELNLGSFKGLQILGFIHANDAKPPLHAVVAALDILHHSVESHFTDEELEIMGYDLIVLEHTLCKISRLNVVSDDSLA